MDYFLLDLCLDCIDSPSEVEYTDLNRYTFLEEDEDD